MIIFTGSTWKMDRINHRKLIAAVVFQVVPNYATISSIYRADEKIMM